MSEIADSKASFAGDLATKKNISKFGKTKYIYREEGSEISPISNHTHYATITPYLVNNFPLLLDTLYFVEPLSTCPL